MYIVRYLYVWAHDIRVWCIRTCLCMCSECARHWCVVCAHVYVNCTYAYFDVRVYVHTLCIRMHTFQCVPSYLWGWTVCCLLITFPIPFLFMSHIFLYIYCLLKFFIAIQSSYGHVHTSQVCKALMCQWLPMSHQPPNHLTAFKAHTTIITEKSGNSTLKKRVWAELSSSEENSLSGRACWGVQREIKPGARDPW